MTAERRHSALPYPNPCCPFCGDASMYRMWLDPRAPVACVYDEKWKGPGACKRQWDGWNQRVKLQEACPEAFDETGKIIDWNVLTFLEKDEPLMIGAWRPRMN